MNICTIRWWKDEIGSSAPIIVNILPHWVNVESPINFSILISNVAKIVANNIVMTPINNKILVLLEPQKIKFKRIIK